MNFQFLQTPAFLVDRATVERNCASMREKARRSGVRFRPHVKTHKTVEGGRIQHGGIIGPITVSTLAEAEFFAEAGFGDITYAFPVAPEKLPRAMALASRIDRLNLLLDHEVPLAAMEELYHATGATFDVFLKVDCGYHRAGVDPDAAESERLASRLGTSKAVRFHGLLTHAGHSYDASGMEEVRRIAAEETAVLTRFRQRIGADESMIRSVGSTPTAAVVQEFADCDEVRPGNYLFFDAFQARLGSCNLADCAVSVLASVVGAYPDRGGAIIDAGALALSKDRGPEQLEPEFGYGVVCDELLRPLPLKLIALSQEHGKLQGAPADIARLTVGGRVRVIPNHSCLTAAMFDRYHVITDAGMEEWKPARGW